jgi:hypothetical protein
MSTLRQKELAKAIVENVKNGNKKTAGELLEDIGYAKSTSEAIPGEIIGSEGVQQALAELGFTEDRAKRVVAKIMNDEGAEPNARLKAADMTFKVHGSYAPDKSISLNANVNITPQDEKAKEIAQKYEEELLGSIEIG